MKGLQPYQFPFAKYPAVRIVLLIAAGIITAANVPAGVFFWMGSLLAVLAVFFLCEYVSNNSLRVRFYYSAIIFYLVSLFLFGGSWYMLSSGDTRPLSQSLLDSLVWEQVQFRGDLQQIKQTSKGKYQLDLRIDSTVINDSLVWKETYLVRAILDPEEQPYTDSLRLGDQITFLATVYPLEGKRNPHAFDYKAYLASRHIYNQVGIDTMYSIRSSVDVLNWYFVRQTTIEIIDQNFSAETASLAKALLIGYKNELDRHEKVAFSRVGLSHIMAVSGLHVGFLLAPFWFVIPWFWTMKYGRQTGLAAMILLLFFYAGLTGFSASVTRASITGGFIMYARLFNKVRDSVNLTALAAIIILLINPRELFTIGFQLSFTAVYIILLTVPVISRMLPRWIRFRWYAAPVMIVLVSVIVQIGLYPLLSYYFGEFSLIGPLANALVVPFLTVMVPYALLLLPFSCLFPVAGFYLNIPNQYFLEALDRFVTITSSWSGSWVEAHMADPVLFGIWIFVIFFIASLDIPRLRWKMLCLILGLLCLQQGMAVYHKQLPPNLEVTVFDVGQGDATLVKTPLGKHFLVDTGRWTPGYNSARHVIIPHLKAAGIQKLDAVFLSHPHADHIGGILDLIREIPVDTIYNSGFPYDSDLYKTYTRLAEQSPIPVVSLSAGAMINLDPSMRIFIYGPDHHSRSTDPNEHSLILELIYGTTELLFMGDAGREQELRLLKNYDRFIDTDFLKVGHHGSRTSSSDSFLHIATPEISVVSLAKSNRFGHPHAEAIYRLHASGTQLYFTSLEGALVFTSDGTRIQYTKWK